MALYATDGSLNIRLNDAASGAYTFDGFLRVDTVSTSGGQDGPSGAARAEVSNNAVSPPSGSGIYTSTGGLRMTQSPSTNYGPQGKYALDGSLRVTVNV